MLLGHVTLSVSFVLVIVRSRLLSIGGEYETAAQDLGATRMQAIRTVLLPSADACSLCVRDDHVCCFA